MLYNPIVQPHMDDNPKTADDDPESVDDNPKSAGDDPETVDDDPWYNVFGFIYKGVPLTRAECFELSTRNEGNVVRYLIEFYTFKNGEMVTAAIHFMPHTTLGAMQEALQSLENLRIVPLCKAHPISGYVAATVRSVGILRTKIRYVLLENRHRSGFASYVSKTLPKDMFGIPNPAFVVKTTNKDDATTIDCPADNASDMTLDIYEGGDTTDDDDE